MGIKKIVKKILPESVWNVLRKIKLYVVSLKFVFFPSDIYGISYFKKFLISYRWEGITRKVLCYHRREEIRDFVNSFLKMPSTQEGCVVEAGAFKGGGTAKISILAKLANRKLVVFDSFEGMPENKEAHDKNIFGRSIKGWFDTGTFLGSLDEVKNNIKKYGEISSCTFVKGWFEDTMPNFKEKICAAYIDVDLASSTKTCLKYLYPLLVPGGVLFSQDGDFPLVIEVLNSNDFWEKEIGCRKPIIEGLGEKKLIKIIKPAL